MLHQAIQFHYHRVLNLIYVQWILEVDSVAKVRSEARLEVVLVTHFGFHQCWNFTSWPTSHKHAWLPSLLAPLQPKYRVSTFFGFRYISEEGACRQIGHWLILWMQIDIQKSSGTKCYYSLLDNDFLWNIIFCPRRVS